MMKFQLDVKYNFIWNVIFYVVDIKVWFWSGPKYQILRINNFDVNLEYCLNVNGTLPISRAIDWHVTSCFTHFLDET